MPVLKECPICGEMKDSRGFDRHKASHRRRGAGHLAKGRKQRRTEDQIVQPGAAKITSDQTQLCFELFPTDPLLFNAQTFLFAAGVSEIRDEQLEVLKSAMVYIDLKIQSLGGWNAQNKGK